MEVVQAVEGVLTHGRNFLLFQWLLVHLDDVGRGAQTILHHQPRGVLFEVASFVVDGVLVLELAEKSHFFQDVLPFLKAQHHHVRVDCGKREQER